MFPAAINLADLDGNNGFVINGIDEEDRSGESVSNAGDVNDDGIDDIIISTRITAPNGKLNAGESYVVFGQSNLGSSGSFELSALDGNNGFVINGIDRNDFSGESISNAGDVNDDGIDDLIIGAPRAEPNDKFNAGESYVIFGDSNVGETGILELSALDGNNGFVINGIDEVDYSGVAVSNAGDVNGDGIDDLIIGARGADPNGNNRAGESYVIFGGRNLGSNGSLELSTLDGINGFVINGIDEDDYSGVAVSNAGDVNGDGLDDLIIGARSADPNGIFNAGESYVIFGGRNLGSNGSLELSALDGTNGFVINGIDLVDFSGGSVSNAGDVNGDGLDDLIIGARTANPNGKLYAGESYVVFGSSNLGESGSLELSALDGTNGFVINGIDSRDFSGGSVSNAGDINGDGIDDLIIGAKGAAPNGNESGESYLIFGSRNVGGNGILELSALNGTNGFVINGIEEQDYSGISVSNAGDVNGDGLDDIIIGAYGADPNGKRRAGESYVIFGFEESVPNKITGTVGNDTIDGTINADKIHALAGNDRVRGLAGDDTINGDAGQDTLFGNNGNDLIDGGDGNDIIWGQADNDSVTGGSGRERVLGNNGNDTLLGGNGIDTLFGGEGNDLVFGNAGNDQVIGNAGDDTLFGGTDNDILFGYAGEDELHGGEGDDVLWGQAANDFLAGGAGTDVLYGNNGNDVLVGGDGTDSLFGNAGNDSLAGNTGSDILFGNNGNDILYGGPGNDTLWSGTGSDFFELTRGTNVGVDRVKDYQDGIDKFLLSDRFGLGSLEFSDLTITQNGNNAQIKITETNQLLAIVDNTNAEQLNSNDFVVR